MLGALRSAGFDIAATNHAEAILESSFAAEMVEILVAISAFEVTIGELIASGGGEAQSTQRLRRALASSGWTKHAFTVATTIDGVVQEATTHEIDHVRRAASGTLALEIEWNNKDPFFDRDLENFQRLHARSVVDVGLIVTRGEAMNREIEPQIEAFLVRAGVNSLRDMAQFAMPGRTNRQTTALARLTERGVPFARAFARTFVTDKFGQATTHWRKLIARVERGVGRPCPLLLIGLPATAIRS